jgi:hypothetical protein
VFVHRSLSVSQRNGGQSTIGVITLQPFLELKVLEGIGGALLAVVANRDSLFGGDIRHGLLFNTVITKQLQPIILDTI